MCENNIIKIVVDVNVWISFFRRIPFRERCLCFFQQPYQILYSDALLKELEEVIHRPKHWNLIDETEYERTCRLIERVGMRVDVHSIVTVCRDVKDNYLLALAVDGYADYIITGDKDLLTLQQFGKTKIVDLTVFEKDKPNKY